ncbi:MAG: hypothetical protein WC838_04695 [Candidatus Margulisiibacteriota bacterium]
MSIIYIDEIIFPEGIILMIPYLNKKMISVRMVIAARPVAGINISILSEPDLDDLFDHPAKLRGLLNAIQIKEGNYSSLKYGYFIALRIYQHFTWAEYEERLGQFIKKMENEPSGNSVMPAEVRIKAILDHLALNGSNKKIDDKHGMLNYLLKDGETVIRDDRSMSCVSKNMFLNLLLANYGIEVEVLCNAGHTWLNYRDANNDDYEIDITKYFSKDWLKKGRSAAPYIVLDRILGPLSMMYANQGHKLVPKIIRDERNITDPALPMAGYIKAMGMYHKAYVLYPDYPYSYLSFGHLYQDLLNNRIFQNIDDLNKELTGSTIGHCKDLVRVPLSIGANKAGGMPNQKIYSEQWVKDLNKVLKPHEIIDRQQRTEEFDQRFAIFHQ